jgi:hypothetical protein
MQITNKFDKNKDKIKGFKHVGILANGIVAASKDGIV